MDQRDLHYQDGEPRLPSLKNEVYTDLEKKEKREKDIYIATSKQGREAGNIWQEGEDRLFRCDNLPDIVLTRKQIEYDERNGHLKKYIIGIDPYKIGEPDGTIIPGKVYHTSQESKDAWDAENKKADQYIMWGKSEKDKYFTPDIEDIRVGYEFEARITNPNNKNFEKFIPYKVGDAYEDMKIQRVIEALEQKETIRVPYLTEAQILMEGWRRTTGMWFEWPHMCENGFTRDYKWRLNWPTNNVENNHIIFLEYYDGNSFEWCRGYDGPCKDINTLRVIQKLLGIRKNN